MEQIVLIIACTKLDQRDRRTVSVARAQAYAQEVGAFVVETSARDGTGVEELFLRLCDEVR